jgi:hypothetical protein
MQNIIGGLESRIGKIPALAVYGKHPSCASPAEKTEKSSGTYLADYFSNDIADRRYSAQPHRQNNERR